MTITIEPTPLVERLRLCGEMWADASGATLARLGRTVINDGGYFSRVEANPVTTTLTLERFAAFLGDPANWPDALVPKVVCEFVRVVGVEVLCDHAQRDTSKMEEPSPGKDGEISGPSDAAACGEAA